MGVASMTSNLQHDGLHEAALGAMQALAPLHVGASPVLEASVEAIVNLIQARNQCPQPCSHSLLWAACDALHTIMVLEHQCLEAFMQRGGIETIVQAMMEGPTEQPGVSCCFAFLQYVAKRSAAAHNRVCAARTLYGM